MRNNFIPENIGNNFIPVNVHNKFIPVSIHDNFIPVSIRSNFIPVNVHNKFISETTDTDLYEHRDLASSFQHTVYSFWVVNSATNNVNSRI